MSNSHPLRPFTAVGEIDHVHILSEHIGALLIGEEYGDVTFVVEKKRFPAHRVILAARCQYFRALLYGGMRESQPEAEIPLQDTTAEAFTMLLRYIYTGRATLTDEKEEVLLDFLSLAHKYGFPELEDSTSEYLCTILNIQNVCMTFDVASLYSLPKLTCMCCMFMDRNAQEVLASDGFLSLSKTALLNIVLRDSFAAPEKDIFLALLNWCKHNAKENHAEIMQAVRLPLMSLTELLNVVRPSGLLSPDAILDAIKVRSESRDMDLNYRGMLIPEENIATMKYGAQVVKGELKSALLDGDTQNYDLDHGFSRHPIDDDCRSGIEIKLGQPSIINHIRLLLWDRDSRSYSYFIEVSMDELDWIRVIDHSRYLCRSWQKLYFPARVCRYIRIVGTHNTVNKIFHIVAFECMFTNKAFTLEKGLIVPLENVATIADCASVIEGVSRSRNALLNGDTKNYDWDSGYTCHQLGSGAIVVQLAQPYMIGSIR
ncbi:BTB/POZ domain-containing protein 9 isoform X3 [Mus caroli]|nr:BTB/POZ domain-containing protein 9 isoform X3 [Mus caroli]